MVQLFEQDIKTFPKSTIATIVGIGGMAGGIGSFCINMGSGRLFDDSILIYFLIIAGQKIRRFRRELHGSRRARCFGRRSRRTMSPIRF